MNLSTKLISLATVGAIAFIGHRAYKVTSAVTAAEGKVLVDYSIHRATTGTNAMVPTTVTSTTVEQVG